MELEDLDSLNKSDFLPLLSQNIKQELFESNNEDGNLCDSVEKQVDAPSTELGTSALNKCVWCTQVLSLGDNPKLLECLHVSCENCIKSKFDNANHVATCAVCQMPNELGGVIDNQFLIEQIMAGEHEAQNALTIGNEPALANDTDAGIKCSSCSDDVPATSWCVECSEYICDSCVQAHQRLKITKDHTIKPKEEANADGANGASGGIDQKNILCPTHAQEKLSLFCETCDRLTCRDCQLVDHRDHKYKFANEIAADTRNTLNSLLGEISYKRVLLTSAMKVIDDRQSLITEKKKESVREIKGMVMKVTNAIQMRSKILVMRLNEVCDSKLRVLNEKKLALQQLSGHTDHCIEFVQNALDKGSDSAVLFSKRALVKHLQQVKCQRADIPNPEIPVRIQVLLNGVSDLQRDIGQMGTIVVDGKVYPPPPVAPPPPPPLPPLTFGSSRHGSGTAPSPNHVNIAPNRQQQASPNMAPLIRLGSMIPPNACEGYPPMYPGNPSPTQNYSPAPAPNINMNRQFSQPPDQPRFPSNLMGSNNRHGPPSQAPGPHVSSSTHPQNIDMSLRSLLNNQGQQQQMQRIMQGPNPPFASGNTAPATGSGGNANNQHMRGHYGRMQGASPNATVSPYNNNVATSQPNFLPGSNGNSSNGNGSVGPRFQGINPGQCMVNCNPTTIRPAIQNTNMYMGSSMQFSQPNQQQMRMSMMSGAKWHIPQQQMQSHMQHQTSNGPSLAGFMGNTQVPQHAPNQPQPTMNFQPQSNVNLSGNNRQSDTFKINLKSPPAVALAPPVASGTKQIPPSVTVINSSSASTLSSLTTNCQPSVTSTIPKTPSPNVNESSKDSDSIDKLCAESMNDLMVTIAKLDSNGVQVLPEGRTKATSPLVHSSTDIITIDDKSGQKDDPNEDWCAVCLDGGELMCCDKCPKVFHQNCHIPPISNLPDESETWQCLLCINVNDIPVDSGVGEKRTDGEMSARDFKILQRILLEMYCQYDISLAFRDPEPVSNEDFYNLIKHPVCLDDIRQRLDQTHANHYRKVQSFVNDVRLMFKNSLLYHQEKNLVSKIIDDGRSLEQFFDQQMAKWMPHYGTRESMDDDRHRFPLKRMRKSKELD